MSHLKPEDAYARPQTPTSPLTPSPAYLDSTLPGGWPSESPSVQQIGTSAPQSLSAAVKARKDEYTRKRTIKVKVGTWNVASISGTEKDLGGWFVHGLGVKGLSKQIEDLSIETKSDQAAAKDIESVDDQENRTGSRKHSTLPEHDVSAVPHDDEIGLYVLGLQEVIDVTSVTEAVKPYTDPNPAKKWKEALREVLPPGYQKVATQQLLGLLILVFASPTVAPTISSVSCTSVGTGLMGYLGNKGAVSVRLVLAETTRLCFINCHLAAGSDQAALTRRIWDTGQVVSRTRFTPVAQDGDETGPEEKIGDEDFAFWFGDLNYRLDDIPGEDVRRLLLLHTRNEYDIINKSRRKIDTELGYMVAGSDESTETFPDDNETPDNTAMNSSADPPLDPKSDPASLITTLHSLLSHDQLHAQQRLGKAFHDGWREGEINFLPTYKYDVGSVGMFDSGEKKRSPSWCDRILFRTRTDRLRYEEKAKREAESRKKDEDMKKRGLDEDAAEQAVLFDYDPDTDGLAYGEDYDEEDDNMHDAELVETHEGYEDSIEIDHYISHQRVLSSDHKPLDAIFTLTYDAVIPELKAKIHQEVARELDKAENEGRPGITVVADSHENGYGSDADGDIESRERDSNCVDFGQVRYKSPRRRTITVANTGQSPATFSFIGKGPDDENDAEQDIAPEWVHVESLKSTDDNAAAKAKEECTLAPGETRTIHLTIYISSPSFVHDLNNYRATIDDILILRVTNGRDHFVPIRAVWLPTCFHRTLDELVLAPENGVRYIPKHASNRDATGSSPNLKSTAAHHSAPKELFALTEAIPPLVERCVAEWDILHPGTIPPWKLENGHADTVWPFDPETWTFHPGEERDAMLLGVREALDTAQAINVHNADEDCLIRLEVLAETLVDFLGSLRDGIVTEAMWPIIENGLIGLEKAKTASAEDVQAMVMEPLSSAPVHSVSMTFLTFMLGRVIKEVAPVSKDAGSVASPKSTSLSLSLSLGSRRSRASSMASQTSETSVGRGGEGEETGSGTVKRVLDSIRRKRGGSTSTGSTSGNAAVGSGSGTGTGNGPSGSSVANASTTAEDHTIILARRKMLMSRYSALFAPLVVRTSADASAKGKERKLLETRRKRVVEAFLAVAL
jgi:inositol polyphosphate 5-phosphatase INPP5B/F